MNSPILYQWIEAIDKHFPRLGRWQVIGLALLSYGLLRAESCCLHRIARELSDGQGTTSMERRLQRWLANRCLEVEGLMQDWVAWVLDCWGEAALLLLVDETKLSGHLSVMMVSVYYQQTAIPLVWRAYGSHDYPHEGQVGLLMGLLDRLRAVLPPQREALLLADRGLGTSPRWQQALTDSGWDYLLRVQGSTRLRLPDGSVQPLKRLVGFGQRWFGHGEVFKKAGWQRRTVLVVWEFGYAEPWCLVSNRRDRQPLLYAWRFAQEASFRDLKSDGFHWQRSRVWSPAHAERLLLALALAAFWTLATGTIETFLFVPSKAAQRLSLFRRGLEGLFARFRAVKPRCLELYLVPDTPCLKTVVF